MTVWWISWRHMVDDAFFIIGSTCQLRVTSKYAISSCAHVQFATKTTSRAAAERVAARSSIVSFRRQQKNPYFYVVAANRKVGLLHIRQHYCRGTKCFTAFSETLFTYWLFANSYSSHYCPVLVN